MENNASFPDENRIETALSRYREGKITIGRAANIAGIPLRNMIAIAAMKNIPFQYSLDDLREDSLAIDDI